MQNNQQYLQTFQIRDNKTGKVYEVKFPSRKQAENEVNHQNLHMGNNYTLL